MLHLKYDLNTQLDNPLIVTILLTVIVIFIVFLTVDDISFCHLKKIFIYTVISSFIVIFIHYKQLKSKFYIAINDNKSQQLVNTLSIPPMTTTIT